MCMCMYIFTPCNDTQHNICVCIYSHPVMTPSMIYNVCMYIFAPCNDTQHNVYVYIYIFTPSNDTHHNIWCVCIYSHPVMTPNICVYVYAYTHTVWSTLSVYHYFWVHFGCAGNQNLKSTRTLIKLKKIILYLCRKIGLLKASNHMLFFRYVILKTCLFWSQSHKVFQRMCIMTNCFLCVRVCGCVGGGCTFLLQKGALWGIGLMHYGLHGSHHSCF